ncbi:uncharacterized protein LOC125849812 [Solanum stenotomum]|uniref:uncharacterized protein LOC125849812 n=1 Tax=Solanum stenotomum TaxID=172797 RepID=UPI0020D04E0A|nr:uncharacterized protein LOC125849812 [Solanum stenotomum]
MEAEKSELSAVSSNRVRRLIMHPRRAIRGRPARMNVEEQRVGQQRGARQEVTDTSRIREFLRMNPSSFTGSSTIEDPESFVEELKNVSKVMHVADVEQVEVAVYQLKNVPRTWFDQCKKVRAEGAPLVEEEKLRDWEEFRNKKAKTSWNESGQQRNNENRSFFQQNKKGPAPSSASAPSSRNKGEYNSQNSQHL